MNKENTLRKTRCMYCSNESTGIIYRPNNQIKNVFACMTHATNLFIPFQNTRCDKKQLQQSRYRSPLKQSQLSNSAITQVAPLQPNPEPFFDRLMENIIQEFNTMKKQIMTNYHSMIKLEKNQSALSFTMQGDSSYPYMIINQDDDMMMNTFVNRILSKHNQQKQKLRREQILKRRMELFAILSTKNQSTNNKSPFSRDTTSVNLSKSIQGSPPYKSRHEIQTDRSSAQYTQRKNITYRDYCKTQKRQKK